MTLLEAIRDAVRKGYSVEFHNAAPMYPFDVTVTVTRYYIKKYDISYNFTFEMLDAAMYDHVTVTIVMMTDKLMEIK